MGVKRPGRFQITIRSRMTSYSVQLYTYLGTILVVLVYHQQGDYYMYIVTTQVRYTIATSVLPAYTCTLRGLCRGYTQGRLRFRSATILVRFFKFVLCF